MQELRFGVAIGGNHSKLPEMFEAKCRTCGETRKFTGLAKFKPWRQFLNSKPGIRKLRESPVMGQKGPPHKFSLAERDILTLKNIYSSRRRTWSA